MTYEQNKLGFVSPAIDEYLLIIRKLIKLRFNFAASFWLSPICHFSRVIGGFFLSSTKVQNFYHIEE